MRAQHITFSKAIKAIFSKILKNLTGIALMALLKVICWALIFIIKICFPPSKSLATILNGQLLININFK